MNDARLLQYFGSTAVADDQSFQEINRAGVLLGERSGAVHADDLHIELT